MSFFGVSLFRRHKARKPAPAPRSFRPMLEALEDRTVPSGVHHDGLPIITAGLPGGIVLVVHPGGLPIITCDGGGASLASLLGGIKF